VIDGDVYIVYVNRIDVFKIIIIYVFFIKFIDNKKN
jgi:hypothetical protein